MTTTGKALHRTRPEAMTVLRSGSSVRSDTAGRRRRMLYVRWALSAIDNNKLDNNKLALPRPKTRKSSDWVALSPRIHALLTHRKTQRYTPSDPGGFVFHREDGRPLHPESPDLILLSRRTRSHAPVPPRHDHPWAVR
ncbi:hypothetical protein ACFY1A_48580 [Streptomyces sp. NPDC001520]|uniref:hypothetical protein n=1 Tax=Streptomyces sp. NPDC001520 TaxID=3364581 RepID=UPI003694EBFC